MGKRKIEDRPYVANYPPLNKWLEENHARCAWQLPIGKPSDPQAYVEGYFIGPCLIIVLVYADRGGWDVFTPAASNSVEETLADATARIRR